MTTTARASSTSLAKAGQAVTPSKEGKDAQKMQLTYEYDIQTVAEAVTQDELSSHKVHPT